MVRIIELIDDFKLNQEIIGRKPKYVEMCIWLNYSILTCKILILLSFEFCDLSEVENVSWEKYGLRESPVNFNF